MTARTLAVWKFASCDGCQLRLLDQRDGLLALARAVKIAYFPEVSRAVIAGPYDLSLVEGSISTPEDALRIRRIRARSRHLVSIGACATAGGVQALRNSSAAGAYSRAVYPNPDYIASLDTSTPISDHVEVDFELQGCPVDGGQLLEVVSAFLGGRRPAIPRHAVCHECKARGVVCVLVAGGTPCLGPVTRAGCGAACPAAGRGCFGCFGPVEEGEAASAGRLPAPGAAPSEVLAALATFNGAAPALRPAPAASSVQATR